MKKVLMIVFNNFVNDARVLKEATTLQRNGYQVKVVALHQANLKENELINDIEVHRIKLRSRPLPKSLFFQIIKYIELLFYIIKHSRNVDIIHCNDLEPLPMSVFIKKFINRKIKIIYDAHEYETERNGLTGIRKKLSKITEKKLIKYVDSMITVSDGIAKCYASDYNIKPPFVVLNAPNYYTKKTDKNIFRQKFKISDDQLIFLYQGGLLLGRNIENYLEVFSELKGATLVIMGSGPLENTVKEYANKYENIFYQEAVSPTVILDYTSSADVGLCIIQNVSLSYYYALPNKFFEYLMSGLPVIVNNIPELTKKVTEYQVGWVLDHDDNHTLKQQIESIIKENKVKDFKNNTINFAKKYNWETQESILLEAYNNYNLNK